MKISPEKLKAEAEATGFRPDVLEKVAHLLGLLDAMRGHPFLEGKLALKGGTALNLFVFDVPRLSVNNDLNSIGAADRIAMLAERPKIEQAFQAVFIIAMSGRRLHSIYPISPLFSPLPNDHRNHRYEIHFFPDFINFIKERPQPFPTKDPVFAFAYYFRQATRNDYRIPIDR